MLEHRHRLNTVVVRRTKADACRPDGSPLFARRQVHTEAFVMDEDERAFYTALTEYLQDGFALAKRQGGKGVALGFVMTIFQKIAASSFAAVARTLRRRLIALTVHEGLAHDEGRDIDRRDDAFREARALIRAEHGLSEGRMADLEADRLMNEVKRRILKKLDEEGMSLLSEDAGDEAMSAAAEEGAAESVSLALPEERLRIKELLGKLPPGPETKVRKILGALGALWRQDPTERIVIFATYLGSVEMLGETIATTYPGQGVVVLKGGDHGSKAAAERRFKQADGPRVMICTAAGREGLNMQHARILINFDLPWNPMDMEQRIGRIHRYGQKHTAQVYNLVLSDTIEGRISATTGTGRLPTTDSRSWASTTRLSKDGCGSRVSPPLKPSAYPSAFPANRVCFRFGTWSRRTRRDIGFPQSSPWRWTPKGSVARLSRRRRTRSSMPSPLLPVFPARRHARS